MTAAKEMEKMRCDEEIQREEPAPPEEMADEVREPENGIESLKAEIEEARAEAEQCRNEAARAKADFYNYRTRIERDRTRDRILAAESAVLDLLPVLDNLERALDAESDRESSMYRGISMVQRQFFSALQNLGLKVIDTSGAFDPSLHEAVTTADTEDPEEDGMIMEVFHRGYMLGDKVLQAAKVKVGRKKSANIAEPENHKKS
ncbi:MAG: nucleotide exchange factor GrpE [Synergistaceae bacterium]|jgi:molecular chaperone GrpE|nr:nucleotide exchange factor GrpE [Synergistaceae bacterium]